MVNLYVSLHLDPSLSAVTAALAGACWVVVVSLSCCGVYVFKHAGFLYC